MRATLVRMTTLADFSTALAELVTTASNSIVQVRGGRRPVSGVVHGADTVLTSARALGGEENLGITLPNGDTSAVQLAGWDPATGLAVLRSASALNLTVPVVSEDEPRAGELAVPVARSWSNAITASPGFVATAGGPLRTGRRRQVARVFRVTSPVHDGFAGGGVFDAAGRLAGVSTAAAIRGYAVCIPASLAWQAAQRALTAGTPSRGFIGVGIQSVALPAFQAPAGREQGLLVTNVVPESPAHAAGLLVGDLLLDFNGHALAEAADLLDRLATTPVGQTAAVRLLRGNTELRFEITVGARPVRG
jgi:S1-C subfamily serine protease